MYTQSENASRPAFGPFAQGGCRGRHWGRLAGRRGLPPWARFGAGFWQQTPVNIEDTDASFVLTLYAAGLAKDQLQVSVRHDVLTIAYPGPAEPAAEGRYTRREFQAPAFERSFQLNGKVLIEQISAAYAEGILTVTLPKTPAASQPAQPITVQ